MPRQLPINEARTLINDFMKERISFVESVFTATEARGELSPDAPVSDLVEIFIAVPYFLKFIAGAPLDQKWRNSHVEFICRMAEAG